MLELMDPDVVDEIHDMITSKVPPKVQERIKTTASKVCNEPACAYDFISDFISQYGKGEMNHIRLMRNMMASIDITWKSFQQATNQGDVRREFNKYIQRMLVGAWLALKSN